MESVQSRSAGEPVMAIVSLRSQRITVYDAKGWILRAPVSSGSKGRETPAGIFSVIQKVEEHYSNLYDDAFMPHMHRITWSGIALHGGVLPGRPASHGCVRLPFDFAERLFDVTAMGMRVIVSPSDVTPVDIAHPLLFQPRPGVATLAASRAAEAEEATKKAAEARSAASAALREATQARAPVRAAENQRRAAETQLAAAEAKLLPPAFRRRQRNRPRTPRRRQSPGLRNCSCNGTSPTWTCNCGSMPPRLHAMPPPPQRRRAPRRPRRPARPRANFSRYRCWSAARPSGSMSGRPSGPSWKVRSPSQILIVRSARTSSPPPSARPTAPACDGTSPRWSASVAADGWRTRPRVDPLDPRAKAALDRIVIPQDALDRIAAIAPRSSLIVTDEGVSPETGKGTEFVVVLSGEPQGGIKKRRRNPGNEFRYARQRGHHYWQPFGSPFLNW